MTLTPPIAAIVLAAGESRRMGRPKMLLPWADTTILGKVVRTFAAAGADPIVVVTGGARQAVEAEAVRLSAHNPVRAVFNEGFSAGEMLSSLQCGLRALGPETAAALVGLGDQPQVETGTIHTVLMGFTETGAVIVVPSFENRRGHPWLVAASLWPELLAFDASLTPRHFLRANAERIHYVNVGTPSVLQDVDTPEDLHRHQT